MSKKPSVTVIGAGLGGLCAGIKLKEAGLDDVTILEKATKVGGTWRDNSYPGCCCDTPASLYEFSFAPSLIWDHIFPRHDQVQQYAEDLADTFGLRPHLKLNEEATSAVWDDARAAWKLTTSTGNTYEANAIIVAVGQLNRPRMPEIEGQHSFAGPVFHSARWDHGVKLDGMRVAVIGSAASAVQIVPEVAKVAEQLTVFQRSPNWVVPRLDRRITDEEKKLDMTAPHVAMMARELAYQNADYLFWQTFSWTREGRDAYTRAALDHLQAQIHDPALRKKLTPEYPIGCRRILFTDDYYPALMRPNVALVTDRIARFLPLGIETEGGRIHEFDIIVYATGFETTGWHWSVDVVGKGDRHLCGEWSERPTAYLGITATKFPNMFILYGPNTNLSHNSITFMIERQVEYVVQAIKTMHDQRIDAMELKAAAHERFNRDLQMDLEKTTWADTRCRSWYKNAAGQITQNWSSHTRDYAEVTKAVRWEDYDLRRA